MSSAAAKLNPFPGLRPFTQEEDYLFFGREEQTLELLQRLASNRFVAVVGTSGSGKSSLVRCGLLSELLGGRMLGAGSAWEIAVTHPGGNPLALLTDSLLEADLYDRQEEHARENLLATLSRSHFGLVEAVKQAELGEGTNFLLVVDQFEEIFRFQDAGQRQQEVANEFISLLLEAVAQKEVPIYVVLTMRSDFIGECGQFEGLAEMVNRGEFLIPRLTREQYKRVIEGPIKVAGGQIAPRLLQRLLNDLGQQADQLPCLQHALMRTWEVGAARGDSQALDLDAYQRIGRMAEALSLHADEIYESLGSDRQRELCRGLFQALTVEESNNRGIRRPQRLGRLCQILEVPAEELLPIIEAYRQSGVTFLMPSPEVELVESTIIDISHESLMRVWTRLRQWVEEETQAAGIYNRLAESAALHELGKAGLYRDPELGIALAWQEAKRPNAAWAERYRSGFDTAMAFLEASQQASVAEEQVREAARQRELAQAQQLAEAERRRATDQARAAVRLRWMVRGLGLVAMVALMATAFAWMARQEARSNAKIAVQKAADADAQRQISQILLTDVAAAKELAERNLRTAELSQAEAQQAEQRSREFRYSTDVQLAATLVADRTANASQIMARLSDHDPDSNSELKGKEDLRGFEWHYLKRMVQERAMVLESFEKEVVAVAMSPAGELVTLDGEGRLQHFNSATGQESRAAVDLKKGRTIGSSALSADGLRVALAIGDKVHLVDVATGEEAARPISTGTRNGLLFSPNGKMVITVDSGLGWWDAATGNPVAVEDFALTVFPQRLKAVSVSDDGLTVAVGRQGPTGGLFSVFRMEPPARGITRLLNNVGDQGTKRALAISPDGQTIAVSLYFAGSIYLYDATTGKPLLVNNSAHPASVTAISFSADSTKMVTAAMDGSVKVWADYNQLDTTEATSLVGHAEQVDTLGWVAAGKQVVSTGKDKSVRLWNGEQDGKSLHRTLSSAPSSGARYSPDGTLMAISGDTGAIQLRDGQTGEVVASLPRDDSEMGSDSVAFSPDNRLLAAGFGGKQNVSFIELWDIDRRELLAVLPGSTDIPGFATSEQSGIVSGLAFSPDAKHLVASFGSVQMLSGGNRGNHPLLVYDVPSRHTVRRLEGPGNTSPSVAFSADGTQLASACYDGTARIWDTASWQQSHILENPDQASERGDRRVMDVAFSPDGRLLAMASAEGNVILWEVKTGTHLETLKGHANEVGSVAFSPDGRTLASGSMDGTIRLWNTATWRELMRLEPGTRFSPRSLKFSPGGDRLLAADGIAGVLEWSIRPAGSVSESMGESLAKDWHPGIEMKNRVRMLSENLRLHERLAGMASKMPEDQTAAAAAAATAANWQASAQHWEEAVEQFDRLQQIDPQTPDTWLRMPGLLRVATALFHQHRPADAASLLAGGEKRRAQDGNGKRSVGLGIGYTSGGKEPSKLNRVYRGSPAWQAGMRAGDRLLQFNDVELNAQTRSDFLTLMRQGAGTQVKLTIQHPGPEEPLTVQPTVASFINDDVSVELIEALLALVDQQLVQSPSDAGLHELRAELMGLSSDYEQQVISYTAAIESLAGSGEERAAVDLVRVYGRRGNANVGLKHWQQAVDDYARSVNGVTTDDAVRSNQALAMAEALIPLASSSWTVLKPVEAKSKLGATLSILPDDSILASGANPQSDRYRVVVKVDTDTDLAAVRLEALTHDSLPAKGPGRYPGRAQSGQYAGTFGQSFLSVTATPPNRADPVSLQFQNIKAIPAAEVNSRGVWNIAGSGEGRNCSAVWSLSSPVSLKAGTSLIFEMEFGGIGPENLGHFRLSLLSDPAAIEREEMRLASVILTDPWQKLAAAYRIQGNQQSIDQLVERRPQAAGDIGDLFISGNVKDWQRTVEIYSLGITPETTDEELLGKRAKAYEELQDWNAAAVDWSRAAKQNPAGAKLLADFASRLLTAGKHDLATVQRQRARTILEQVLQADPGDAPAIDALAALLLDMSASQDAAWTSLIPVELKTTGGNAVVMQEDASFVLTAPVSDTLALPELPGTVRSIRVETANAAGADGSAVPAFKEYRIETLAALAESNGLQGRYIRLDLPGNNNANPRGNADGKQKFINLAELQVYHGDTNIALGKKARQSSGDGEARLAAGGAVDGNTVGNDKGNPYAHTWDPENPWWEVDLGSDQAIDRLIVWNRSDIDIYPRMNHFRVRILDASRQVIFEQVIDEAPKPSREIDCRSLLVATNSAAGTEQLQWSLQFGGEVGLRAGRRFRVSSTEEVSLLKTEQPIANPQIDISDAPDSVWTSLRPAKLETASGRAVTLQEDGSFAITGANSLPLLQVPSSVKAVRIETAKGASADGSAAPAFKDYRIEAVDAPRSPSGGLMGRFVRVDLPGDNRQFPREESIDGAKKMLNLAEVQVFQGADNVAYKKPARQSSTVASDEAGRAVDGTTNGLPGSYAHTNPDADANNPWWEVDLVTPQNIDRILVWNRTDGQWGNRLKHFRVRVLDAGRNIIFEQVLDEAPQPSREIDCHSQLAWQPSEATPNHTQWSLHASNAAGVSLGQRMRVSYTQELPSLDKEEVIAEDRKVPQAATRLAAAFDINSNISLSQEWFRRALSEADSDSQRKLVLTHLERHPQPLTELINQQPDNIDLQLALARSQFNEGQKLLTLKLAAIALPKLLQAQEVFSKLMAECPEPKWTVLTPTEAVSKGGATLTVQHDGSILASGENPELDSYTLTMDAPDDTISSITALRIEAIPDPSMMDGGVGRGGGGSVALSSVSLTLLQDDESERVSANFDTAIADIGDANNAIDQGASTIWAVYPEYAKPHQLALRLSESLSLRNKARVVIGLEFFNQQYRTHGLGRFRLSVATDPMDARRFQLLDLQDAELAALDVSIGIALAYQGKPAEAAAAFVRALERVDDEAEHKKLIEPMQDHSQALAIVAEQRPQDLQIQLAVAKHFAERGKSALAENRQEEALTELARARELFAKLAAEHAETQWTVLQPTEMTSAGGTELTLEADNSIIASGANPDLETYTLRAELALPQIAAIRLETLPDSSFPNGGSGRDPNGSFNLNELTVTVGKAGDQPNAAVNQLVVSQAFASYHRTGLPIEHAIDATPDSFWQAWPQTSVPQQAVIQFAPRPGSSTRNSIVVRLTSKSGSLGRFRLAVSGDPDARNAAQFQHELTASGLAELEISLGNAHARSGRLDEAANAFSQALKLAANRDAKAAILATASAYDGVLDQLTLLRADDAGYLHTLARHHQTSGDFAAATAARSTARSLYERQLAAAPSNAKVAGELADLLFESRQVNWIPLHPEESKSAGGADLKLLGDNSILASGINPDRDVYTIVARPELLHITGFRLEALPDDSLPLKGPGRATDFGNFHLNELSVWSEGIPVRLTDIATVHDQSSLASRMIDGKVDAAQGWSNYPNAGQANAAFIATDLQRNSGSSLKFELHFSTAEWKQHNLGRFRLSATDTPSPLGYEQKLLATKTILSPWARLGAAYHGVAEFDRAFDMFARSIETASGLAARSAAAQQAAAFEDVFSGLQERFPDDPSLRLGQAKFLVAQHTSKNELQLAADVLSTALTEFPTDLEMLNLRADAWMKLANWKSAEQDYSRVIELEGDDGQRRAAQRARAEALVRMGQFQAGAEAWLQEMMRTSELDGMRDAYSAALLAGNSPVARMVANRFFRKVRDKQDLDAYYSAELVRLHTALPGLVTQDNQQRLLAAATQAGGEWVVPYTAAIHYRLGELEKAQPLLDLSIKDREFQSLAALLLVDRGESARASEFLSQSERWLRQQSQLDPRSAIPAQARWDIWTVSQTVLHEAARKLIGPRIAELDELLAKEPDRGAELLERAEALAQVGLYEEALSDLQRLGTLKVDSPASLALHGRILAGLGRDQEALPLLNRAIEGGLADGAAHAARGAVLLRQQRIDAAREDLEKSLSLKPNELAAGALADLLLTEAASATRWTVLEPTKVTSEGGATLAVLDDHSILASGKNPLGDAYRIVAPCGPGLVSVIRLEALTDESLPNQGPGRDEQRDRGNFDMVDWEIRYRYADDQSVRMLPSRATADYSAAHIPIGPTRWNIGGGGARPHTALFLVENPATFTRRGQLAFRLQFSSDADWPKQNLGRFRLAIASDPSAFELENKRLAALQATNPWFRLHLAYQLHGKDAESAALVETHPEILRAVADDQFDHADWEGAIAGYSKLIGDKTSNTSLLVKRGEAYFATKRFDLARADWRRAVELTPELAQTQFDRLRQAGRWGEAGEFGLKLIEQNPEDTMLWIRTAPMLAVADDPNVYSDFCGRMLQRFAASEVPETAERLVKILVLRVNSIDLPQRPVDLLAQSLDDGTGPAWFPPWGWGTRALLAYRRGETQSAVKYVAKSEEHNPAAAAHATNLAVLAMAQHQLQYRDQARLALDEASQIIARLKADPAMKGDHDLLIAEILFHEAEALMKEKEQSKESDSEEK